MTTMNNSIGFPNWSQLKNYDEPYSTCNVTSAINAAQCSGFDIMGLRKSIDPDKRPADDLYEFLHSDNECLAMRDKLAKQAGLAPNYPPNELMEVLAFGLGKWLNSPKSVEIHFGYPLSLIMQHIIGGGNGVLHGHYPTQNKDINHINAVVGCSYDGTGLVNFIIDDPYGDYRKLYANHMGNDIIMPLCDIVKYIKNVDDVHNKDIILIHRG